MPPAWAIAAAAAAAVAYVPLITGIVRGTVREERLSWAIWAGEYALLFRVQAARGGGPLLWLIGAGTVGCCLTFALTLWRGRGGLSRARLCVLVGSLTALAAWQHARSPALAFGVLVTVETAATIPTVLNAYRHGTEPVSYWLLIGLAAVLEIPALTFAHPAPGALSYGFAAAAAGGAGAVLAASAAGRRAPGSAPTACEHPQACGPSRTRVSAFHPQPVPGAGHPRPGARGRSVP